MFDSGRCLPMTSAGSAFLMSLRAYSSAVPVISAETEIDAPLESVWQIMLATDRYPLWNPFVIRAETPQPPRVGQRLALTAQWSTGRIVRSLELITLIEPPKTRDGVTTARWLYIYQGALARPGLMRGVRQQSLRQEAGGPTRYATEQRLRGTLAPLAFPRLVQDGLERHAAALRRYAHSQGSQPGSMPALQDAPPADPLHRNRIGHH